MGAGVIPAALSVAPVAVAAVLVVATPGEPWAWPAATALLALGYLAEYARTESTPNTQP